MVVKCTTLKQLCAIDVNMFVNVDVSVDVDVEDVLSQAKRRCQPLNLYSDYTITYTIILVQLYYDFQLLEFALGNHKLYPDVVIRGPIHRRCPKIYLKTCHKIIL